MGHVTCDPAAFGGSLSYTLAPAMSIDVQYLKSMTAPRRMDRSTDRY